jgi:alcohol dehydrogenase class IV
VILPHALEYNAADAPDAMRRIARALGAASAAAGVFELAERHHARVALRDIGMPESGLDHAAELAVQNQYPNPRRLDRDAIRTLLQRAFEGVAPG